MPEKTRNSSSLQNAEQPATGSQIQSEIQSEVESYYTGKFLEFGEAARGVDWRSPEHQQLRFEQLLHVLDGEDLTDASLLDYGCGYGALYEMVRSRFPQLTYFGFDLSKEMLAHAVRESGATWLAELPPGRRFDFSVASGVFNVKLGFDDQAWRDYVETELMQLFGRSVRGCAVNFVPPPTPGYSPQPHLFYVNPSEMKAWCESNLGAKVEIREGYGIHDVTLILKREAFTVKA